MSKNSIRAAFEADRLFHAMAAHNPLSARLAEEAGFNGIWASGFEASAAAGVPDASIISLDHHLQMTRAMASAVAIPVIADIDTGYGNAINVMHVVREYHRAGAAAVVMEDKHFPKDTSLLAGGRQELVSIEQFVGKIQAAKATVADKEFLLLARTEALIAGQGQDEALKRASAYEKAGADAIVVHSKSRTPDEVIKFVEAWNGGVPIVLIPTAYPDLTEAMIAKLKKVGIVIYGNHCVRAMVTALQDVFGQIRADGGIHNVDKKIVSVERIFELQNVAKMKESEKKYLR
ncbi:phosphonopyruvate hydrolase [Bradyrhizobium sp. AUGA SZCCT0431]|uniref:phosphonopyruvate hydrolase n=1 Tax=Bradyrhizobium sp. AUGA SZCCT0431 TaxID=2807674 RepID=UPI001BA6911D|nr:phosphonopyruvate hydrolase [Bradyrhizobium sp. AUGA SZCCT0431]MBR1146161.1 phosphonopyruvate hydrolase [Bradyrhizobium sp. AUGA SZCCT0431]